MANALAAGGCDGALAARSEELVLAAGGRKGGHDNAVWNGQMISTV